MTRRVRAVKLTHHRARRLRRDQTAAESALWTKLRAKRLDGLRFRRQFTIDNFIADFCCREYKLVIELDGIHHAEQAGYDAWRTQILEQRGFRVMRFSNDEVLENPDGVVEAILEAVKRRSP
jgi:very-short-patch-repair endonuclease